MALPDLKELVTAIGGLGTAAFGLVEASKAAGGSVNHIGFSGIRTVVTALTPSSSAGTSSMSQTQIIDTLHANWMNGTDLASQKAIAKSLIKLNLNAGNAAALAAATGVDPVVLSAVAAKIANGNPMTPVESDVYARFDLIVTALLDECYQRGDQVYRNWTRFLAMLVAIALAYAGEAAMHTGPTWSSRDIFLPLIVGLLATPLAPIAKDISTALATAVNTLQLVKK